MKLKSVLVLGIASWSMMSLSAHASIEVKAKRMLTENVMAENVAKVKQACGNPVLDTNFDWSAWDNYDFAEARLDQVKTTGWLGGLINYIYDDMVKLCTTTEHAALYKAEFEKVKKIQFVGQESVKARKAEFALAEGGSVLNVALNPNAAYDSSTLKYLKQAWN
ncbi:hypothetical protein [Vibrio nereis]|uniref:hypothetical protein n=1 Tax=Vibrio nereis TaxID=693 RepID=UPI00249445D7|nr:hypothetical protein [Vibrio nereis]